MAINRYLLMFLLGSLLVCSATAMLASRADAAGSPISCATAKHRLHRALASGNATAIAHARAVKRRACAGRAGVTCSIVGGVVSCHTTSRREE